MIEAVGEKFSLEKFLNARKLALKACEAFHSKVEEGMTEKDGLLLMDGILSDLGIQRKWHPTKFRFSTDTTKSFREKSELTCGLKKGDVYFLDIGPVFDGHEADIGRTFVFEGNNEIASKPESIFLNLKRLWLEEKLSGKELYASAMKLCESAGVVLNPKMAGHRLGDFPHALHYKGSLVEFEKIPCENLWVLEVHILNKEASLGAFYEDILLR